MKKLQTLLLLTLTISCNNAEKKPKTIEKETVEIAKTPILNLEEANRLAQLPPLPHESFRGIYLSKL